MSCLDNAKQLIDGPRRQAYGPVRESFGRVALAWSGILNKEITPQQVALMMIAFKVMRESNSHQADNIDDIAGYAALLEQLYEASPLDSFMDSEAAATLQ